MNALFREDGNTYYYYLRNGKIHSPVMYVYNKETGKVEYRIPTYDEILCSKAHPYVVNKDAVERMQYLYNVVNNSMEQKTEDGLYISNFYKVVLMLEGKPHMLFYKHEEVMWYDYSPDIEYVIGGF